DGAEEGGGRLRPLARLHHELPEGVAAPARLDPESQVARLGLRQIEVVPPPVIAAPAPAQAPARGPAPPVVGRLHPVAGGMPAGRPVERQTPVGAAAAEIEREPLGAGGRWGGARPRFGPARGSPRR